ncbi:hypothetical protein [Sulfurimonas diazotrophicus]|uniref:WGR domain-containing protein n=1 Tax=Sulfurimonas diazotrophicus TaxID=3131939 RepID=A0ABZ3HBC3_9BACT
MTLVRKNNRSLSYYKIVLYPTLFNDYLVIHHCGLHCSKSSKKHYFSSKKEALLSSLNIISAKKAEGFELLSS